MAVMQHLKFKNKNWNKVSQSICIVLLPVMGVLPYEIPSLVIYDLKGVLFKCDPLCCPSTPTFFASYLLCYCYHLSPEC